MWTRSALEVLKKFHMGCGRAIRILAITFGKNLRRAERLEVAKKSHMGVLDAIDGHWTAVHSPLYTLHVKCKVKKLKRALHFTCKV